MRGSDPARLRSPRPSDPTAPSRISAPTPVHHGRGVRPVRRRTFCAQLIQSAKSACGGFTLGTGPLRVQIEK
eukprot:scaffold10838_cov99-Isochrysis_galbana.AAC.8